MWFNGMSTRSTIHQRCVKEQVPKNYIDFSYPFCLEELDVIASGDEDKYNNEVDPRTIPLRPGILIPREQHPVDTNAPSGLEWYT